uniref:Fas-activated serine/threonine kinase isoform X1 n=1 Tax=Pogona vitticeps TaxID=103695 RepID=A0ABM5GM57_9SAUR
MPALRLPGPRRHRLLRLLLLLRGVLRASSPAAKLRGPPEARVGREGAPAPPPGPPKSPPRRPPLPDAASASGTGGTPAAAAMVVPRLLRLLAEEPPDCPPPAGAWVAPASGDPGRQQLLLRCLRASAALGLPGDHPLVCALEEEARRRLPRFCPEDVALLLGSILLLHPLPPLPPPARLLEGCLRRLETLPGALLPLLLPPLLACYRLRAGALRDQPCAEAPVTPAEKRRILRLVLRLLEQGEVLPEQERGALEEVVALCAPEAGEQALQALFRSPLFTQHSQQLLVHSMSGWFPDKVEGFSPPTVASIARHLAWHRLREIPLLDSIAAFLLQRVESLDIKVIQRLIFPFSRLSYQPPNHLALFPSLAAVLKQKAPAAPLATLNILMSLFQLQYFPAAVLSQVFSPGFVANVTSSPCGWIAQNYLSLLDAAVQLELSNYSGPRLDPRHRVSVFHRALATEEVQCSYKRIVREALRQLVGKEGYRQDTVLPPGYRVDFLLWITSSGRVLPIGLKASRVSEAAQAPPPPPKEKQGLAPFWQELPARPRAGDLPLHDRSLPLSPPQEGSFGPWRAKPLSGMADDPGSPARMDFFLSSGKSSAATLTHFCFPTWEGTVAEGPEETEGIHRVVLCVNDKWHYCQNAPVLVGSRAMRNRHLRLLGYCLLQLPYLELDKLRGLEEAKQYLWQKLRELRRPGPAPCPPPGGGRQDDGPDG